MRNINRRKTDRKVRDFVRNKTYFYSIFEVEFK